MVPGIADEARHDAVTMESCAKIFRTDEEIAPSGLLGQHVTRSPGVDLKLSSEKISDLGKDIMVSTDPHDLAASF